MKIHAFIQCLSHTVHSVGVKSFTAHRTDILTPFASAVRLECIHRLKLTTVHPPFISPVYYMLLLLLSLTRTHDVSTI